MDGTNIIQPEIAEAKRFWRVLTGSEDAPIRLRYVFEGRPPIDPVTGAALDPIERTPLALNPATGEPFKPRSYEDAGTLDDLWPKLRERQAVG